MKQVNVSCNGNESFSQAVIVWPSGIHGEKKPVIYPLAMSEEETDAIREYLERKLDHPASERHFG